MANKILSFQEYNTSRNEEAPVTGYKKDEVEPVTEEVCEGCGMDPCDCDHSVEEETEEVESTEEVTEEEEDVADLEVNKTVSEMLKECYEKVVTEACTYESDDYPEHTVESYLKENAALCAGLAAEALELSHEQVRETELTQEMYEAACDSIKEAFAKRMDECKESWAAK